MWYTSLHFELLSTVATHKQNRLVILSSNYNLSNLNEREVVRALVRISSFPGRQHFFTEFRVMAMKDSWCLGEAHNNGIDSRSYQFHHDTRDNVPNQTADNETHSIILIGFNTNANENVIVLIDEPPSCQRGQQRHTNLHGKHDSVGQNVTYKRRPTALLEQGNHLSPRANITVTVDADKCVRPDDT